VGLTGLAVGLDAVGGGDGVDETEQAALVVEMHA
jgi:hypothetical protein